MIAWYEPIEDLQVDTQRFVTDSEDLCGFEEWSFRTGKTIPSWPEGVWFRSSSSITDGPPDDALRNHLGLPIFSRRLREAVELYGISGIQFLPVRVYRSDDSELTGYTIANFLNIVSALDLTKSEYSLFESDYFIPERRGRISALRKPVLLGNKILDKDVVRLSEFPIAEFVSQKLVQAYQSHNCSGYSFHEVQVTCE